MAKESPELAHLRWPLTAVTVFWVICVQVVIVCAWQLLDLVQHGRIFSDAALKWVDTIIGAVAAALLVLVGVFLWVGFQADDPGGSMVLFLLVMVVSVAGLLMTVMRALLRQATALRSDLDGVI